MTDPERDDCGDCSPEIPHDDWSLWVLLIAGLAVFAWWLLS